MTTHNPPSDCVGHCVGTASETTPQGMRETTASAGPTLSGTDAVNEPSTTTSETTASLRRWTPDHPSTIKAWDAITQNLHERAARGLWGSRSIAVSIARNTGLTAKRADDLIRSAVHHGYLEERTLPTGGRQVRIADPKAGA